jgi:glutathione S-transferase
LLKLINNGPSPFGRKVMVALHEKNIPFDTEWDIPWHEDTTVGSHNPLEQLPILVTETGETVYESSYILEWLEARYPDPPLVPSNPEHRLQMGFYRVLGVGIMDAIVRTNFELAKPAEHQSEAWIARHIRKINGGLGELEKRIGDREFVVGKEFSLGDVEVGCVLGHLDFVAANVPPLQEFFAAQVPWHDNCPGLTRYTAMLEERPSFKASTPFMVEINFADVIA